MQALLLPASPPPPSVLTRRHGGALPRHRRPQPALALQKIPSWFPSQSSPFSFSNSLPHLSDNRNRVCAPVAPTGFAAPSDESETEKLAQVAKRLENTSRYFKRLGSLGFWGQLVCTIVAAVILSFSVVITGKITSPATFYATAGGIAAAFVSVFWSFGYIRLSERLRRTASDPAKKSG